MLPEARERVALTYNMNILQGLDAPAPFLVTLNHSDAIDPAKIIKRITLSPSGLSRARACAAQARQAEINGAPNTYFCGAYWRFGFHEDGVVSALDALEHFERSEPACTAHSTPGGLAPALCAARARLRLPAVHDLPRPGRAGHGLPRALAVVDQAPDARLVPARGLPGRPAGAARRRRCATGSSAKPASRPAGPIRLLTHLRYFGYCFNPVSFYYCFDARRDRVETIVAEITNTPWNERHAYVLPTS